MTPTHEYVKWLEATGDFFKLDNNTLLDPNQRTRYVSTARGVFYHLCDKANIDMYELSTALGKHRATIRSSMTKGRKPNRDHINKIWENVNNGKTTEEPCTLDKRDVGERDSLVDDSCK